MLSPRSRQWRTVAKPGASEMEALGVDYDAGGILTLSLGRVGKMLTGLLSHLTLSLCVVLLITLGSSAQKVPVGSAVENAVKTSRLTVSDGHPFHLKATTTPANEFIPDYTAEIEEYWISPASGGVLFGRSHSSKPIVVNGAARFEKCSSDYYPKWLNDIVIAILDVAPEHLIDDVKALPDTVITGKGVSVKYQPSSTDGKVTNAWWGSISISPSGVLTWISGKFFAAGFKNHTPFHEKLIPRTVRRSLPFRTAT